MSHTEFKVLVSRLEAHCGAELDDETVRDIESLLALARGTDGAMLADANGSCAWLGDLYGRYVQRQELAEARALLVHGTGLAGLARGEGGDFAGRSYARVRDLFESIDFSGCQVFIMVGCGPLPVTLLHVAERTRVLRLVGLDVGLEAAESAREVCHGLGLERVEIRDCDGCHFDYSDADVVYVANLVRPKHAVLRRVAETVRPETRVVVREPSAAGALFAERGADPADPRWRVIGSAPEDGRFLSYHLFLQRLP